MKLDPFYPIVDSTDWLERLLPQGIRLVQLRIKDQPVESLAREIKLARNLCHQYRCQLIVNDYWELAIEQGCDYIHLGQEDLDDADITVIRRHNIQMGISTHDDEELERALSLDPDYVALGPVYPTILKKMKWHQQGLERVTDWKQRIGDLPLIGIGGVTPERAPGIFESGADVVSLVTDITLNPDPEQRTRDWIQLTRQYIQ